MNTTKTNQDRADEARALANQAEARGNDLGARNLRSEADYWEGKAPAICSAPVEQAVPFCERCRSAYAGCPDEDLPRAVGTHPVKEWRRGDAGPTTRIENLCQDHLAGEVGPHDPPCLGY